MLLTLSLCMDLGLALKKTVPKQLKHFQLNKHISQPLRGKISRTCVFQIITFFWLELKYDNSTCLLQAGRFNEWKPWMSRVHFQQIIYQIKLNLWPFLSFWHSNVILFNLQRICHSHFGRSRHTVISIKQNCYIRTFVSPGDEQKLDFAHEDVTEEFESEPWKWKQSS